MRSIEWRIDGIISEAKLGNDHPTFQRGETETLEFYFARSAVEESSTLILGTESGTTLGEESGGTLSSDGQTPQDRFSALRDYIETLGTNATGTTLTGEIFVREYLSDGAPVDSRIVKIEPGDDIRLEAGFWVAIESGTVTAETPGRLSIEIDVTYLARATEYQTREDLMNDLSSPITQL